MLISLVLLILLPTVLLSLALSTSGGASLVIGQVLARLPFDVQVEEIDGRLLGPLRLSGLRIRTPQAEVDVGRVEFDWAPARLFSKTLRVERLLIEDVEGRIIADGSPAPAPDPEPAAGPQGLPQIPIEIIVDDARITRVNMLLAEDIKLVELKFSMNGSPDDYEVEFSTSLEGEALPPTAVSIHAEGGLASAELDSLIVESLGGLVSARASVQWYPELMWTAEVVADSLEPGLLAPDPEAWAGHLNARFSTEGQIVNGLPTGTALIDSIYGSLREYEVAGSGEAEFQGAERVRAGFDLEWSSVLAHIEALVTDSLDATLQLECGDLGLVLDDAAGQISLEARASGPRLQPRVFGQMNLESLHVPTAQLDLAAGSASFDVDLQSVETSELAVMADSLTAGSMILETVALNLQGDQNAQELRVEARGPELDFLLAAQGTLDADSLEWEGSVDSLQLWQPVAGRWHLAWPANISASKTAAAVDSLRLEQGAAAFAVSGDWTPELWSAQGEVVALPLALAAPNLEPGRRLNGTAGLQFQAEGQADGRLNAELEAALADASFAFPVGDTSDSLLVEGARLSASVADSGTTAELELTVATPRAPARMELTGEAWLPGMNSVAPDPETQEFEASVQGGMPDLSVFTAAIPALTELAGSIELSLEAGGTLAVPGLSGEFRATGLHATHPELGLEIQDGEILAQNEAGVGFSLSGRAQSGGGSIELSGEIPRTITPTSPAQAKLVGDRFQGMRTPEVHLLLSPDLQVNYDGSRIDLTGELLIPLLQIEIVEVPETAVPVSKDVVIVEEEVEAGKAPIDTRVDVQLILGDEVAFKGFGAEMELTGQLGIKQDVPKPPHARGDIRITEGSYTAYGQNLDLERGVLSFVGPPENPNLDMRAARTAPDGTVAGLLITGTAEEPKISVYTEPQMSDSDAISYLVTGRPLDGGNGDDRARVGAAAALLGSNVLSSKLGSKIGLDEARVETGGTVEEAALVTGKYITPNMYLSYAMGLFDRSNLVRLRYTLTPRWAVQTETGTTQGADVFYNIEFGGN